MNAKVMVLGTFHFSHNNSMKSIEKQAEILEIVDKLAKFKPNKIAVEERTHKQKIVDENFRLFSQTGVIDTNIPWHINETAMLGYQTALQCGITKIHAVDYMRLFFYDRPVKYAKRKYPIIGDEILRIKKEFREFASHKKDETLIESFVRMNSPEYISMLHNADYLSLNQVGALQNYIGAKTLASWYKRNLGIFANLQTVCVDGDRVLVVYGAGHLSILNTLVQEYSKMDFVSPLEYL